MSCKQPLIKNEDEYGYVGENLSNIDLVVLFVLAAVFKSKAIYYEELQYSDNAEDKIATPTVLPISWFSNRSGHY